MANEPSTTTSSDSAQFELLGLNYSHLIVIVSVYALVIFICLCLINARFQARKRALRGIPRNLMPYLRQGDLSNVQRAVVLQELVHSSETKIEPQFNSKDHRGFAELEDGKMHNLRSIVATSYVYLEGAATEADQSLARNPTTTVHDYVLNFLPKHCFGIDMVLCQAYVDAYERARFSNEEFTLAEFSEFKEQFRQLLEFLHNQKKRSTKKSTNPHGVGGMGVGGNPVGSSKKEKKITINSTTTTANNNNNNNLTSNTKELLTRSLKKES